MVSGKYQAVAPLKNVIELWGQAWSTGCNRNLLGKQKWISFASQIWEDLPWHFPEVDHMGLTDYGPGASESALRT